MKIPEIRERLRHLGELYREQELYYIADQLREIARELPDKRTMTPELATAARTMKFMLPEVSTATIAYHLRVDRRRVREALKAGEWL